MPDPRIASEVATENLRAGVPVVVDGVHATHERRARWRDVSEATGTRLVQLEMTLSDRGEHRLRVETRQSQGYPGPTWEQILGMEYDDWNERSTGLGYGWMRSTPTMPWPGASPT